MIISRQADGYKDYISN